LIISIVFAAENTEEEAHLLLSARGDSNAIPVENGMNIKG
jgi:hypothetical protein